ncbi:hypothetical protein LSH36_440g01059 [Paralvinella palmiformis]|uniref:Uncharacterized protein n=1 Tax=Paralvinella palmiformis TaxID=53620 RepID=A0AAD9JAY4_9ANNE|nr:hypothetical protein LSH36_440g01059 [Paralvinella palmiformis]
MATSVKCARCVILSYISSSVTCRLWLASHGLRLDDYINESSDVSTALWPQLVSDGVRDVRALGLPPHHGAHSSVDPAHRRLGRRRLGDRPGRDTGHVSADASCQTVRGSISDADGDGEVASMRAAPTPLEAGLSRPGNASTYLTAVKSLLELMSAELGLVDLRSRLHLTDAHDLATCRCQQQDAPEVDVRPETERDIESTLSAFDDHV